MKNYTPHEIGDDMLLVRIKNTRAYAHIQGDTEERRTFIFKTTIHGACLFKMKSAQILIQDLVMDDLDNKSLEIVPFKEAMDEHLLVEKQIMLN